MHGSRPVCDACGDSLTFLDDSKMVGRVQVKATKTRNVFTDAETGELLHECPKGKR